jgi:hypothetical protein
MTIQAHAYTTLNPSFIEPEFLLQYSQASGFIDLLADSKMRVRMASDDLLVYMKQMNVRTRLAAAQFSGNELPGVDIATNMISVPTYLQRVRAQYDHHDVAAGGRWGFAVPEAYRLGGRQAHFQFARDAALYGYNPQNSEGIVNAPGAVALNFPPDPNGNTTATTYDNGAAAFFLMQRVAAIKTATYQLGIGKEFTIIGPQRVLSLWEYNVVQLVQYQRIGAGTQSTAGTFKEVLMANGDKIIWTYDDTLIGKGAGGTDLLILAMPTVTKPAGDQPVNTNEFAKMTPGANVCITQYADMAAPREIISPLAGGATDFVQEWRITPGWPVRPQAINLLSIPYP